MQITKLTPNLVVRNVEASLKFYREILGLEKTISVPRNRLTFSPRYRTERLKFSSTIKRLLPPNIPSSRLRLARA